MSAWFLFLPLQDKKEYAIEKKEEIEREVVTVQVESFPDYDEKAEGKEVGVLNSRNDFDFDGLPDHEVKILDLMTQPYVNDFQVTIEQQGNSLDLTLLEKGGWACKMISVD